MVFGRARTHGEITDAERDEAGSAADTPASGHVRTVLELQATGGNAMVGRLLRSMSDGGDPAPVPGDELAARIQRRLGRGEPLPAEVPDRFGTSLGAPLSGVRIHRDAEAAELAGAVDASAFTAGTDVFFASGAYRPDTAAGAHLLAHELAHTVQHDPAPAGPDGLTVSEPGDRDEVAADRAAGQMLAGRAVTPGLLGAAGGPLTVHRYTGNEPSVDPGQAESQALAAQLVPAVQDAQNTALAEYQQVLAGLAPFDGTSPEQLGDQDRATVEALTARKTTLETALRKNESDLALLTDPRASTAAVNEVLARRGTTASTALTTESSGTTQTRTALSGGTAVTTTDTSTSTYTPTSATWGQSSKTTAVTGTESQSSSTSSTRSVGLADGQLSYSSSATSGSEQSDTATGYRASSSSTDTRKFGTGGYSSSSSTTERAGDQGITTTSGTSYSWTGGKYGRTTTSSQSSGTVDDKGELISGTTTSSSRGGGVIAGPDGVGGYGSVGGDASRTVAKGVKVGVSGGLDGRFTVNVVQVPGGPGTYQIVLTISLGAKLGTSGSAKQGSDVTRSGSVSGTASGSITATYVHVLPEAEAQKYLSTLQDITTGAATDRYHELRILQVAATEGDDTAIGMLRGLAAGVGDPGAAAALSDGDSVTLATEGRLGASASAGASGGGRGVSVGGGVSAGASMTWTAARKGDAVILTGTPASDTGWNASATGTYGIGSMGYGEDHKSSSSRSWTFRLNPAAPDYDALYRQIIGASGAAELAAVAAAHPELVSASSVTTGTSETDTTTAGLGPLGLTITDGSARSTTTATDAAHQVTTTETGTATGGIGLTFGGVTAGNYNESGSISTTVAAGNVATGDLNASTSESDWTATLKKVAEHPWDSIKGVFTGDTKVAQDTDIAGMKLSDADYTRIALTAYDRKAWDAAYVDAGALVRGLDDWHACRSRIVGAQADFKVLAAALADFVAGGTDRAAVVRLVVRGAGSAEGGSKYEWPGELSGQKSVYGALVDGDPFGAIDAAQQAGNYDQAGKLAADDVAKLDGLIAAMQAHEDKFRDGTAYGEMLQNATERRAELVGRSHLIAGKVPPATETTVPTPAQAQAKDEADRAAAKARYDGLMTTLHGYLDMQTRIFGEVQAEQAKTDDWFDKPDVIVIFRKLNDLKNNVYPAWWKAFEAATEAAADAGVTAPTEPKPAEEWWKHLESISVNSQ
jgi:Domain of unknown function (DUF4157)